MIGKFALVTLTASWLCTQLHAQEKPIVQPVQMRAVLHDPVNPIAALFYTDNTGAVVPLEFRPHDLSRPFTMLPVNGALVLYDKANVDPKNPAASLAASTTLPAGVKQGILVVLPAPVGTKPAYRMVLIDDSANAFPRGESRVLPLLGVETAIQAGEHRLGITPGKITAVPPVKKVNEFHMAQTNFYYKQGETWVPFTERQLQFIDACRRIFIIHATPGSLQPTITTIVDTTAAPLPK